jgi:hypothetical protein
LALFLIISNISSRKTDNPGKVIIQMKWLIPLTFIASAYAIDPSAIKEHFKESEYELISKSSSNKCPDGNLIYIQKEEEGKKINILLLADQINFDLSVDEQEEKVPESCSYSTKVEYEKELLTKTTIRSECPNKKENAVVIEKLKKTNDGLFYEVTSDGRSELKCHYKLSEVKK